MRGENKKIAQNRSWFTFLFLSTFLFFTGLFLVFLPFVTHADTINELKAKIEERNRQIAEIEREIEKFERDLEEVGAEKDTLQKAIRELDLTRSKLLADIRKIQGEINNETLNIERLDIQINEKEERIRQNNLALAEALRRVREIDNFSMLEGVLSENNLSDFWETVETVERFQESINKDLADLRETKVLLSQDKNEVEERREVLVSQRATLSGKTKVVEQNKAEKNNLLEVTKEKEENYQELLEERVRQREQFERELFEFESQLQFELDPSRLPSAGQGVLRWPLDSIRITQKFGKTTDSGRLYASGTHNGVDFGTPVGTNVYASLAGVVEGVGNTDSFRGCLSYGKWVLIRHNNGLSTLYAHLSLIQVSPGQEVKTGELIGFSGNTGYSTGPHLHFTVFASQGVNIVRLGDIKTITNCANAHIPVAAPSVYLDPLVYL